jgi:hypothetical protein
MFSKRTVVILGAGASSECGLPLGAALLNNVAGAVNFWFSETGQMEKGDAHLYQLIRRHHGETRSRQFFEAGRSLAQAASRFASIDEALFYFGDQPDIVEIGKLAIVMNIQSAEADSALKIDAQTGRLNIKQLEHTWYALLFSMAISGTKKKNVSEIFENVTFINFNYDRTLEAYLVSALATVGAVETEATDIVSQLDTIRPYGSLGKIDWHRPFASRASGPDHLWDLAKQIRTFTEAHQEDLQSRIGDAPDQSKLVIVLGFGFHDQNVALFKPKNLNSRVDDDRRVFATFKGIHHDNRPTLHAALQSTMLTPRIHLQDMQAGQLLRELRPSIAEAAT